jgi:hypothetical protein
MAHKSLKELKFVIEKAIKEQEESINNFAENNNPQIKELYITAQAKKDVLEGILYYINTGSKIMI